MASDKLTLSDPPACSLAMSSKFKGHLEHSSLLTAHQELSPLQSPELSALGSLLPSPRFLPLPSHVRHITAAHLHDNATQKHYRCFCLTGLYLMPRNFKSIFKGVGGSKCGEIDIPQRPTKEVKTLALKI